MLLEQGYKVFGITLRLWVSDTDPDDVPLAVTDAKKMCDFLGIEHHVVDARDVFYDNVVDYFVNEYAAGRTPNPCVFCNKNIKFDLLLNRALELGASHMVTGHYAQVRYNEATKLYEGSELCIVYLKSAHFEPFDVPIRCAEEDIDSRHG